MRTVPVSLITVLVLASGAGCGRTTVPSTQLGQHDAGQPQPTASKGNPPTGSAKPLNDGKGPGPQYYTVWGADAFACESDSDCVLSCLIDDGSCCARACTCRVAYSGKFERALRTHLQEVCQGESCDGAECKPMSGGNARPYCWRGHCKAHWLAEDGGELPASDKRNCDCEPGDRYCPCL